MNKLQKRTLAKSQGSTTGKLKKKHIMRAKVQVRGSTFTNSKLTETELTFLGVK
jgi:hypothetical protein